MNRERQHHMIEFCEKARTDRSANIGQLRENDMHLAAASSAAISHKIYAHTCAVLRSLDHQGSH